MDKSVLKKITKLVKAYLKKISIFIGRNQFTDNEKYDKYRV